MSAKTRHIAPSLDIYAEQDRLRRCTDCGVWALPTRFYVNKAKRGGRLNICKSCSLKRRKQWRKDHPDLARQASRKDRIGLIIPEGEWQRIFESQGRRCAICAAAEPGGTGHWNTDHDHITGRLRGILCNRCNTAVVIGAESPFLLTALRYIGRTDIQPARERPLPMPTQGVST